MHVLNKAGIFKMTFHVAFRWWHYWIITIFNNRSMKRNTGLIVHHVYDTDTFDKFEKLITINCFGILLSEVLVNYFWDTSLIVWRIVLISQNASAWIVHLLMFLLSFVTFLVFSIEKKMLAFFIWIFLWDFIYFCLSFMVIEVMAHDRPFCNARLVKLWH